jgi:hypothetical protein
MIGHDAELRGGWAGGRGSRARHRCLRSDPPWTVGRQTAPWAQGGRRPGVPPEVGRIRPGWPKVSGPCSQQIAGGSDGPSEPPYNPPTSSPSDAVPPRITPTAGWTRMAATSAPAGDVARNPRDAVPKQLATDAFGCRREAMPDRWRWSTWGHQQAMHRRVDTVPPPSVDAESSAARSRPQARRLYRPDQVGDGPAKHRGRPRPRQARSAAYSEQLD